MSAHSSVADGRHPANSQLPGLDQLRSALRDNFERLAEALLGKPLSRNGHEWRWGSRGSRAVVVRGPNRGVWCDHEADTGGGPIDLVMWAQDCSFADAVTWSRNWLGMSAAKLAALPAAPLPDREARDAEEAARQVGKLAVAARLWTESRLIAGTPAELYLTCARAISCPPAGWPAAIGFHARSCSLIAAATWPDGTLRAVHRVFLTAAGVKAAVLPEKRTDGVLAGALVRLAAPELFGQPLMVGEGVETALSLLSATGAATWATLGRMPLVEEMPQDCRVLFARDDDAPGSAADVKVLRGIAGWRVAGVDVRVATPWAEPHGDRSDFNDVIQQGGSEAVLARIEAAQMLNDALAGPALATNGHAPPAAPASSAPAWQAANGRDAAEPAPDPTRLVRPGKPRSARTATPPPSNLPTITLEAGLLSVHVGAAEQAIIAAGEPIYQRARDLVRPARIERRGVDGRVTLTAGFATMTVPGLLDVLSRVAAWRRYSARLAALVAADPPKAVAEALLARYGQWVLPRVAGIVTTPTMRPDGSILEAAGYDLATRLHHERDPTIELHPTVVQPTRSDALRALTDLNELVVEFPFVRSDEGLEVSRAVALSALITPVVRGALRVAPAHAFRASTAGTGKSYLADVASTIADGRPCPVIAIAPREAETDARIVGLLLGGFPIVSLDNANGEVGSDLLCQAIERPTVQVRALGRSDITEVETRSTIFMTGNNLRVRGDMVRRVLVCDLDAEMERPEERQFRSDPVAAVLADRSRYVSAALTVVRAYVVCGSPGRLPRLASFAEWSDLVRSALVWLGCADPALSMQAARDDDPVLGDLRDVMACWGEVFGLDEIPARRAIEAADAKRASADEHGDPVVFGPATELRHPALRDALMRVAGQGNGIDGTKLGRWLGAMRGRISGGTRFMQCGISQGASRWRLEAVSQMTVKRQ